MKIVPATPERWDDLADFFTRRGPRGLCRAALRRLVRGSSEPEQPVRSRVYRPTQPSRAGPRTIVRVSA